MREDRIAKIAARCPKCNRRDEFDRTSDDPITAMEVVIICPNCDDGDFHSPTYFTANNKEVLWRPRHSQEKN